MKKLTVPKSIIHNNNFNRIKSIENVESHIKLNFFRKKIPFSKFVQ